MRKTLLLKKQLLVDGMSPIGTLISDLTGLGSADRHVTQGIGEAQIRIPTLGRILILIRLPIIRWDTEMLISGLVLGPFSGCAASAASGLGRASYIPDGLPSQRTQCSSSGARFD